MAMAAFQGFGPNALGFFKALAFHQNRDWFEANRAIYEEEVRKPAVALVEDLARRFAETGVPLTGDGKRSLFRLNRDIRFAKDKSPHKTHLGAVMTRTGDKNYPGLLYFHIDPNGCFAAAGFYMPEPAVLLGMRKAMRAKPKAFEALVAALAKGRLELSQESLMTRLPRGFEDMKASPLSVPLRLRHLIVQEPLAEKDILKPALAGKVADFAKRAMPLLEYGWKAMGTGA